MAERATQKTLREGSAAKRSAILDAARELFLRNGVDRVSMDSIAAEAGVSKRTVYDYFGDKQNLFRSILAEASESLDASVQQALEQHFRPDVQITTTAQLEQALVALAIDLGTSIVGSPDYAAVFALVAQQRLRTQTIDDDVSTEIPEQALEDLIARFVDRGLLDTDNPRLAAEHFSALTVLYAANDQPVPSRADNGRIRQIMVDGVHAFMRAYGTQS